MVPSKWLTGFSLALLVAPTLLVLASPRVLAQDLAPPTEREIWEIARRELKFRNMFQPSRRGFLVEVYAQYLGADGEVVNDSWNLARISWRPNGPLITDLAPPATRMPLPSTRMQKTGLFHLHKPRTSPTEESPLQVEGVVPMIFMDSAGIGTDRYSFQYLGVETLGGLRTSTFMLRPKESAATGAFFGKIWVVDHNIVRFSGTFLNPPPRSKGTYVSFDSLRFKARSGRWLPWRTYVDQTGLPPSAPGMALRARVTVWGFDSLAERALGSTGVQPDENVDSTHVTQAQPSSEDVYLDAESNLVHWLEEVGLMAPQGRFEREVCDPIIQDIVTANQITLDRTLSCRILLTTPVETVLFESVIGISKSVFDLAPNTATVAVLIAREVALAKIQRSHLDLAWGRPETLMLRDERSLLNLLFLTPNQIERDQADDLALVYLRRLKNYERSDLETSAIFLYAASEACKTKPALLAPRFGDGLPGCGREAHISRMAMAAPPGSDPNPAMHIGSRVDIYPSSGTVNLITAQQEHSPFRVIPLPMIPKVAPDDPDDDDGLVQPRPLTHWAPPPALKSSRRN